MKLLPLLVITLFAIIPLAFIPALSFQIRLGGWGCFGTVADGKVYVGTMWAM
jgi:hypothetical protein